MKTNLIKNAAAFTRFPFKKYIYFLLAAVLSLPSCVPVTGSHSITARSTGIQHYGVIQNPTIVDLDVKDVKVTGTATEMSTLVETAKIEAVADAVKKSNADILVEPVYDIVTTGGRVTVTVTGFPATYKNFRPMKEGDVSLVQSGGSKVVDTSNTPPPSNPKKGAGAAILLVTLLIVAVAGGLAAATSKP